MLSGKVEVWSLKTGVYLIIVSVIFFSLITHYFLQVTVFHALDTMYKMEVAHSRKRVEERMEFGF